MNAVTGKREETDLFPLIFVSVAGPEMDVSIDNHMNASVIKDLRYEWNLKILSKLHQP